MKRAGIPWVSYSRRDWLLRSLAAAAASQLPGCRPGPAAFTGELLKPGMIAGHQLRDRRAAERTAMDASASTLMHEAASPAGSISREKAQTVEVAIVGGGIAGLSAAWQLRRSGLQSFRLFELEEVVGGTSRSGSCSITDFPWGAHYVPLPDVGNTDLITLFREMQAVDVSNSHVGVTAIEGVACRDPQERVFVHGKWLDDLYPHSIATESDLAEWNRFRSVIHTWADWKDEQGRRAFAIPMAGCSQAPEVSQLDRITAAEWMAQQGFSSSPLLWLVDYCCRDDYGLTLEQTSAWAALFYFASRLSDSQSAEPPLLTWPAGNGEIVRHLSSQIMDRIELNRPVAQITPGTSDGDPQAVLNVWNSKTGKGEIWKADAVIFAAPQFLTPHVLTRQTPERVNAVRSFQYGAWVVANLHLSRRPESVGVPLSWDNVIYQSASLGYVVATHQVGSDFGPTVWTWYFPLCDPLPSRDRERLLAATWSQWADVVLHDLADAHPDLRDCVSRLDVLIWGHAMIQPRPGFIFGADRIHAAEPVGNIHFAGTDLSGIALMEEAFYHGLRAAREVLAVRERRDSRDIATEQPAIGQP